jgi:hypothetical protein
MIIYLISLKVTSRRCPQSDRVLSFHQVPHALRVIGTWVFVCVERYAKVSSVSDSRWVQQVLRKNYMFMRNSYVSNFKSIFVRFSSSASDLFSREMACFDILSHLLYDKEWLQNELHFRKVAKFTEAFTEVVDRFIRDVLVRVTPP